MSSIQIVNKDPSQAGTETSKSEEDVIIDKVEYPPLSQYTRHAFEVPAKRIEGPADVGVFLKSSTFKKLNQFFHDLAKSVESKKLSTSCLISPISKGILKLLAEIDQLVEDTPPLPHDLAKSRYGNKAYRTWQDKLQQKSLKLLDNTFPRSWVESSDAGSKDTEEKKKSNEAKKGKNLSKTLEAIKRELNVYLLGSFGDRTRIDYGTGHELCFMAFLYCLFELKLLSVNDFPCLILRVFHRYILLMRKLQLRYLLEPAGSRGVWGLDDYQFLPFYFGASQLIGEETTIKPSEILSPKALASAKDYLYLGCIEFILKVKTGVFAEHSPLLNDISGVPDWTKVKNGLYKMYQDDVFKKFPVIQHFFFGSILTIDLKPVVKTEVNEDEVLERKKALIAKLNAQRGITDREKTAKNSDSKSKNEPPLEITGVAPWARPDAVDFVYDTKSPWAGDPGAGSANGPEDDPINMPLPLNPTKKGPPEHGSFKTLRTKTPTTPDKTKIQLEEIQDKDNADDKEKEKEKEKDKETDNRDKDSPHT